MWRQSRKGFIMTNEQIEKYIEKRVKNICVELQKKGISLDFTSRHDENRAQIEIIAYTEDE